jgi:hypothetical protein
MLHPRRAAGAGKRAAARGPSATNETPTLLDLEPCARAEIEREGPVSGGASIADEKARLRAANPMVQIRTATIRRAHRVNRDDRTDGYVRLGGCCGQEREGNRHQRAFHGANIA